MALGDKQKTLWFVRSLTSGVAYYLVEESVDGGAWTEIGRVFAVGDQWQYQVATAALDDLAEYTWRITPVDAADNECDAPLTIGPELVVRTPDAVAFDVTFNPGPTTVTIDERG